MPKPVSKSKTIGINALAALVLIAPGSEKWLVEHPRKALLGLIGANIILRVITKDRVEFKIPMLNKFFMAAMLLMMPFLFSGCATLRSSVMAGIDLSGQPPRASMRSECNGKSYSTQGTIVCEQRLPSVAKVSVKIPPLEGRVIFSNGLLKQSSDFNWYPKEGFWLWKKKPIKDNWIDLDLGEIRALSGDWPVALDVAATHPKAGVIVTRGLIYHRICNDADIPCSKISARYDCQGKQVEIGPGEIGKCERLSGTGQEIQVLLKNAAYTAQAGSKIYLSSPKHGLAYSITVTAEDVARGFAKISLPEISDGPNLIGLRLSWLDATEIKSAETRILIVGFSPQWTGLDTPHFLVSNGKLDWIAPVSANMLEANLYSGRDVLKRSFTSDKIISDFQKPTGAQVACAFAWERDSSDHTATCINSNYQEVSIP